MSWKVHGAVSVMVAALITAPAIAEPNTRVLPEGGTISTVAGSTQGFSGDATMANMSFLGFPRGVAPLPDGGYLIVDTNNNRIRRVSASGTISTVAGSGVAGSFGDGGPATIAQLDFPQGVAALPDGGFLIADGSNNRIRRVSPAGVITTVAGTGSAGFSGDDGPATGARLNLPRGVDVLPDGGFLIADGFNNRIRRVSPAGVITTVAGTGSSGFSGDDGQATGARLNFPSAVDTQPDGGFLIADTDNHRVRRVSGTGKISTVAGGGTQTGDGGSATSVQLTSPCGVAVLPDGGFLIADSFNNRIRRVLPTGTVVTVAGTGARGSSGDGGPATSAQLDFPRGVAVLPGGGYLIADMSSNRIRRVSASGTIATDAGRGFDTSDNGEGAPATQAQLDTPTAVTPLPDGGYLIADTNNHRIRRVSADGQRIITVAGGGSGGDSGFAFNASLGAPTSIALLPDGSYLVADPGRDVVRKVLADETITTAVPSQYVDSPRGVAFHTTFSGSGRINIADTSNHQVLRADADGHGIFPVAGNGLIGNGGDGGAATSAQLFSPAAVASLPDRSFLIVDSGNGRIRKVSPTGVITTVAGTTPGFSGDGGPAVNAALDNPGGIAVLPDGGFLIADTGNHRIREVSPDGTITTVAGGAVSGGNLPSFGDGGPAVNAQLNAPTAVAILPDGGFLIADSGHHRIRRVTPLAARTTAPGG